MKNGLTLEEAVQEIIRCTRKLERTKHLPVEEAGGYLLAEEIAAPLDNPPFSRSPVDGYAVKASDLAGADKDCPVRLKVRACICAGDSGEEICLKSGEAARIMTGAPFPKGSDTAVRQEDTDEGDEQVQVYVSQKPYDNYCFQGEDYQKGSLLLEKGVRLTFAEQGILSSIGRTHVLVYDKPRVRIVTTGDEVCLPGTPLAPGKIYDSNGMMVSSRLRELGVFVVSVQHVGDSGEGLASCLQRACQDADVVVTTGGVSVGKKDILHEALPLMGAEQIFWRVLLQPGTPVIFSVYGGIPILSLSGNPFGAMANVELLLRPLLKTMTDDPIFDMERRRGIFQGMFPKVSRRRRFVRAVCQEGQVSLAAGSFSSGSIGTLRGCNCLMDIPAGTPEIEAGEEVTVWML